MFFKPKRVFFEQEALKYPLGEKLYREFKQQAVELKLIGSHNRVTGIPGKTPQEAYREAKNTMVVGVRRTLKFESCKPSAHYQLPLATSCAGMCEYCYLNTTLGKKPYLRIYVNIEDILKRAEEYIEERKPEITLFEGAATSDPIPVEKYSGSLRKAIHFFSTQEYGRFRFVTKFTDVDSLLDVEHNKHTRFRFSINTDDVIKRYEHRTPSLLQRVEAAGKVAKSGYPLGFIIAPIIIYPDWQRGYLDLLQQLKDILPNSCEKELTFELITHRFTARAKNNILDIYPHTELPMREEERKFKYGQFGYGKYVYSKEQMMEVKAIFTGRIVEFFPEAKIDYLV